MVIAHKGAVVKAVNEASTSQSFAPWLEKAPTRAFSLLRAPTSTITIKNLLKITIRLLTFVNKRFNPPYLLTKNHYIKKVYKNTEKQLICNFSQPPESPVLQLL